MAHLLSKNQDKTSTHYWQKSLQKQFLEFVYLSFVGYGLISFFCTCSNSEHVCKKVDEWWNDLFIHILHRILRWTKTTLTKWLICMFFTVFKAILEWYVHFRALWNVKTIQRNSIVHLNMFTFSLIEKIRSNL